MAKTNTTICLEPTTHELVRRKGWNLSQLVELAVWEKEKKERLARGENDVGEVAAKAAQEAKQKVLDEFAAKAAQELAATQAQEAHLLVLRGTYEELLKGLFVNWRGAEKEFGMKSVEALEFSKQIIDLKREAKDNGVVLE